MKCTIKRRTYLAIYRLLDKVSPVPFDCGQLCGAICCTCGSDDEELGIYLLPGEDKVHQDSKGDNSWLTWSAENAEDFDFPDSWKGKVYFVRCKTPPVCPREKRPLQCRTFPLTPHIDAAGNLSLILNDVELPYLCPLIEDELPLSPAFVKATLTCWKHLIRDPLIYDLVRQDSKERDLVK
ncbi:hypothetical protein [Ihubacter sp. mB4P-1]|uniref:hypothetical protein n=1 Tax=Ihubacter sp. mB4P-1 TaxID=3242370 RepID=UPI003C7E8B9B